MHSLGWYKYVISRIDDIESGGLLKGSMVEKISRNDFKKGGI